MKRSLIRNASAAVVLAVSARAKCLALSCLNSPRAAK